METIKLIFLYVGLVHKNAYLDQESDNAKAMDTLVSICQSTLTKVLVESRYTYPWLFVAIVIWTGMSLLWMIEASIRRVYYEIKNLLSWRKDKN